MREISSQIALLTVDQMSKADRLAIKGGTPGIELMAGAGRFCFETIETFYEQCPMVVLCGPGNNGGDGFVIARLAEEAGWPVRVSLLVTPDKLTGEAKLAYEAWISAASSPLLAPFDPSVLEGQALVVDAVFGAGLSKPVGGVVAEVIAATKEQELCVAAVDVPTGLDGDTGMVRGVSFKAELCMTFFKKKPGHLLMPGRALCGEVVVGDIGIPDTVLDEINPQMGENSPEQWQDQMPWPGLSDHKYSRGHAVVVSGGPSHTGAARLAARAALRVGAGLVTVASPASALLVNATHLTSVMVRSFSDFDGFEALVADERLNSFVVGPGNGVGEVTRARVLHLLSLGRATVLDADALTSFEDTPEALFSHCHEKTVLTPHPGEFKRLFGDFGPGDRLAAARAAAERCGAVMVLKGPDTIIADPKGAVLINANAPPSLATAGSGDVLAGLIAGLMAAGMESFAAAAAGVWIHGEAARIFGPGLISEDLPEIVPDVLQTILDRE